MIERIRILEFVTNFYVGGTERQFLNLVHGLRKTDAELHLACFRAVGPLLPEVTEADGPPLPLREYPLPSLRSPSTIGRLVSLVRYLRRHKIDVVHTTGLYPNVFGVTAAWLARTPVIIASVRDMGQMWRGDLQRLQRRTCRLADAVVTNAGAIADRLEDEGYARDKIEVIHNGIVPAEPAAPAARGSGGGLRRELGIPADIPLVGVISRLDPLKGLDDFLDAAARLLPRHPEARFLLVGGCVVDADDTYPKELRRRAEELGIADRVYFTGPRTDVPEILPELTVSVLPSLTEGLSNSLLEAMAAGLPVVATDVGGNPEIVDHEVTGLLVPPRRPGELAAAMERFIESPERARQMGRAGSDRVRSFFTPERMVDQTMDLYRRLLVQARKRPMLVRRGWPVLDERLSEERSP